MPDKYLPHFYRTIPAFSSIAHFLFKNFLFATILILACFNYTTQLFPENEYYTTTKLQLIKNPTNQNNRQNYYNYIIKSVNSSSIDTLTEETLNLPTTLGASSIVSYDLEFWKDIVTKYPYYRDGYLYYGKALLNTGDKVNGEKMLEKGLMLDTLYYK